MPVGHRWRGTSRKPPSSSASRIFANSSMDTGLAVFGLAGSPSKGLASTVEGLGGRPILGSPYYILGGGGLRGWRLTRRLRLATATLWNIDQNPSPPICIVPLPAFTKTATRRADRWLIRDIRDFRWVRQNDRMGWNRRGCVDRMGRFDRRPSANRRRNRVGRVWRD